MSIVNYNQKHRPIFPGLKIGNGSIGFFVIYAGKRYLVSATHILGLQRKETSINQPTNSLDKIGEVVKLIPLSKEEYNPDMFASIVKLDVRATNELESGLKPLEILQPQVGMEIIAVGRNSGEVKGEITEINQSSYFGFYADGLFRHTAEMEGGDSGGGIFCVDPPAIVGINVNPTLGQSAVYGLECLGMEGATPLTMDIELEIGSKKLKTAEGAKEMDVAPFIKDGRTFVPLRFVSEALGAEVDWTPQEGKTEKVYVYK